MLKNKKTYILSFASVLCGILTVFDVLSVELCQMIGSVLVPLSIASLRHGMKNNGRA